MAQKSVKQMQDHLSSGEQMATGKKMQWSLWDTHKLATADAQIQLFVNPRGQNGNGFTPKTLVQTNGKGAGTIPKGQKLEAFGLAVYLWANGAAINNATLLAIQNFLRKTVLHIKFPGGDDIFQEPLDHIMGEFRQWLHVPTTAGDNVFPAQQVGIPGYYKLNEKITFAALDSYEIFLENFESSGVQAALNNFEIKLRMIGKLSRLSS